MGRHRKIDSGALLDAAQDVLLRDGAAHVTIEAVAANAGVSKATVLYDYKTKQALLRAVLERRFETEYGRVRAIAQGLEPSANSGIHSWIKAAHREPSDEDRTVAIGLVAALASDPDLNRLGQQFFRRIVADTVESAAAPRGALLAFLAVEGLKLLDHLGLNEWSRQQLEAILDDIAWLAEQRPEPRACPSDQPAPSSR